jgi:hypothetical protein
MVEFAAAQPSCKHFKNKNHTKRESDHRRFSVIG